MQSFSKKWSNIFLAGMVCAGSLSLFVPLSTQAAVSTEHGLVELIRNSTIQNGDFESDGNWNFANASIVKDSLSQGRSAKINPAGDAYANGHIWQQVQLQKNTSYTLSAKVRISSDSPSTTATLVVKTGTMNNPVNLEQTVVTASTKDWQTVSVSFNTGENTAFIVGLDRWIPNATAQDKASSVYLDSIALTGGDSDASNNYNIIWAEEFNDTQLNLKNWGYELGRIRGVEQQHYVNDPKNVFVSDGQLTLQITDRKAEDQYNHPKGNRRVIYDSGSIRTHGKQEFLYGRIEMRAKLPKGKGVFPAFWTLGSDFSLDGLINSAQSQPWPVCGEIDIMELIGKENDTTGGGNQTVWQTLHYGAQDGQDNGKYAGAGTAYSLPSGTFNDDYHIFGLNWSKGKMEWYVDNKIVRTVDYSNDPVAVATLDRPQYIQLNLAAGGNWPGDAGTNLAGQKFQVDYVYYARNHQQQQDAEQYYANAATIQGVKDVTIKQGQVPDLLAGVTSTNNTVLDFSIENEYMFQNSGGMTSVQMVCSGKDDVAKIATLPAGKYNIHYTAKNPNDNGLTPMVRRSAVLTIE